MIICYHVAVEESVAVAVVVAVAAAVVKESFVAAAAVAVAVAVAVEGGCDCCLLYRIYYFIVVAILFYCN